MTFYILMNHITTVILGLNLLTTLSFDSEVLSYLYGGAKEDLFLSVTNNNKTLVMKPMTDKEFSNLLVITKKRKYYFDLRIGGEAHQFVEVKHGVINNSFKTHKSTKDYDILEGSSSMLFINKKGLPVKLNGETVEEKGYFSKGVPLLLGGKRILN